MAPFLQQPKFDLERRVILIDSSRMDGYFVKLVFEAPDNSGFLVALHLDSNKRTIVGLSLEDLNRYSAIAKLLHVPDGKEKILEELKKLALGMPITAPPRISSSLSRRGEIIYAEISVLEADGRQSFALDVQVVVNQFQAHAASIQVQSPQ